MFLKKLPIFLLFISTYALAQKPISTAKPWAYWWWMGSAVDEKNITANLEDYAKAGFGGLHIIPIYGVKGEEERFIPYLGTQWLKMLDHTVQEGQRLGLGIDMTLGTGWPFGGNQVSDADAAKSFKLKRENGLYTLDFQPTKQKVKRAAPGAEGWVLDHFNAEAVQRYFQPFDSVFTSKNSEIRAFYNDSYEVYGANWTPNFFQRFKRLRGYDLSQDLDVLYKDTAITEREKRIWADYNETLSDILLEDFTKPLNNFAHKHHKILRNEAHGSPANVLDLYAASDVPESEFFGSKPYPIPYYKQDEDYDPKRFGKPGEVVLKFASSAAHVTGKKLVSSETATWLGNHFKVSLKQVKPIIDESFIGGINHVFFHGIPYSPKEAPFPGWLFYASTNFNQQSHFWEHLPQLNGYIERCQSLLQNSTPDNDILLYFPLVDTWHSVGKKDKTHALDVHTLLRDNVLDSPFGNIIFELQRKGFAYDFVSDRQLQTLQNTPKTHYKVVIVPPVKYMPLETLQALAEMQKSGKEIIFVKQFPETVNGYFDIKRRQLAFDKTLKNMKPSSPLSLVMSVRPNLAEIGQVSQKLSNQSIRRETMLDKGLQFIRKKMLNPDTSRKSVGTRYFISNLDSIYESGYIRLAASGKAVRVYNPLHKKEYALRPKKIGKKGIEIPLDLASGESVFIEVFSRKSQLKIQFPNLKILKVKIPKFPNSKTPKAKSKNLKSEIPNLKSSKMPLRRTRQLQGPWQVSFIKGEPFLPKNYTTDTLQSWTNSTDTATQSFSGKARYTTHFTIDKNDVGKTGWLDLGDVRESAKVYLNGKSLGIAWCLPMRVPISSDVLQENNKLEIEVINLSANRIRYIDRQGENWKKFYDINMVDIRYKPFDASNWQVVESGLLGPVRMMLD
jgi:alpha-L-rhamnosidase